MKFPALPASLSALLLAACASAPRHATPTVPVQAEVQVWLSTADGGKQLARESDIAFAAAARAGVTLEIDATQRRQEMVGFGAAITDASAWLIEKHMNPAQR